MADVDPKPQCGGRAFDPDSYDFPLHLGAIFIVFFASTAGAGFPVISKKVKWLRIPPRLFFSCKHFGTGVLIATAFVHLVPTAFASLNDPCLPDILVEDYPAMPGVIMMFSLFCLFTIEMYLKAKVGGHSHGGPTGQAKRTTHDHSTEHSHGQKSSVSTTTTALPPYDSQRSNVEYNNLYREKPFERFNSGHEEEPEMERDSYGSEMPPWFQVFYSQYVRQREEMQEMISVLAKSTAGLGAPTPSVSQAEGSIKGFSELDDNLEAGNDIDSAQFKKMNLNITLLEAGILFHSIFVGMTISITTNGFIALLVAIIFHQFFEGLGLGSRIAEVPYKPKAAKPWVLVCAFGLTCPIGQVIGLVTRDTYDQSSAFALILVGFFNAFSSGLLIYAALVDLLAEDFLSEEAMELMDKPTRIHAFIFVLLGAAAMSVVGAFA
ncbi:hypothetical protein PV10_01674 [Exophiala mesophila]|uniref:Zinc-regulated transporter 2 n=1 Tax=Exophiala mesophila TaxID=212818 RepID=A0A0D1ZVI6_EXOME|nr:uncharacterized protein PV10_01674 [Exophiala mesophila]KIV97979.1 hypothetical protein PV10_01674 [Exophiala mesophila]